jgi:hypothetical protein
VTNDWIAYLCGMLDWQSSAFAAALTTAGVSSAWLLRPRKQFQTITRLLLVLVVAATCVLHYVTATCGSDYVILLPPHEPAVLSKPGLALAALRVIALPSFFWQGFLAVGMFSARRNGCEHQAGWRWAYGAAIVYLTWISLWARCTWCFIDGY